VLNRVLDTSQAPVVCAVCARSLLRGEHANVFIAGGARRDVCELCTTRAAHEGWIRDGADSAPAPRPRGGERARSLMGRIRSRLDAGSELPLDELPPDPGEAPRRAMAKPDGRAAERVEGRTSERAGGRAGERSEGRGGERSEGRARDRAAARIRERATGRGGEERREAAPATREVHGVPTNAELKVSRALELFNKSEHPKTVSGVARSLGAPDVSVGARSDDGALVEIIVAWELCWYRYEVDLAGDGHAVRLLGQGYELSELGESTGPANAVADGRGALALGASQ
jgi:hypothetical protein